MDVLNSRLETLERRIGGAASTTEDTADLSQQVALIERRLDNTLAENASLEIGLAKYEKLEDIIDGDGDLELDRRLMGLGVKVELLLLNRDAQQTLSHLRTVGELQSKINQPEYAAAAELLPQMQQLEHRHGKQVNEFKNLVVEVSSIIDQYHMETEALSEMFVQWDRTLSSIERKISELESPSYSR